MIVDQDGFTRKMLDRGASHALHDIWKMRTELVPLIRAYGGEVFKIDADNLYVFFHRVEPAVNAAVASHRELARKEKRRSDPLRVSIGIGFGPLYYVSSEDDYYGAEVNLASKLGEDIAFGGETLLTEAALAAIEEPVEGRAGRLRYATVSQVRIRFRPWLV
jgi:class 3 adenylate cyclase